VTIEHAILVADELRFADTDAGTFEGYAARFGPADAFGDVWQRGAFAETLTEHRAGGTKPLMLWSHDPAEPIGVWDDVREDQTGLLVKGRLILEVRRAREARSLMQAGAATGLSVGFRTRRADARQGGGRTVRAVDLIEISLVARPAQPLARVTGMRAAHAAPEAAGLAAEFRRAAALFKRTTQ
jgi:HK97 family phage prohead protease